MTYFWTLCFMLSPHNLPSFISILSSNQVCPFLRIFFFYFILAFLTTSSLSAEVRSEATWLIHVAECEQPGNKGLRCLRSVARFPNFHLHPLPFGLCVKKTPAGMLQWGAVSTQASEAAKFRCCHEEESHSSARKRWEIKEATHLCFGSRTKTLRDHAAIFMVTIFQHLVDISGWWAASFGCPLFSKCVQVRLEQPFLLFLSKTDFQLTNKNCLIETMRYEIRWKCISFSVQLMSSKSHVLSFADKS